MSNFRRPAKILVSALLAAGVMAGTTVATIGPADAAGHKVCRSHCDTGWD